MAELFNRRVPMLFAAGCRGAYQSQRPAASCGVYVFSSGSCACRSHVHSRTRSSLLNRRSTAFSPLNSKIVGGLSARIFCSNTPDNSGDGQESADDSLHSLCLLDAPKAFEVVSNKLARSEYDGLHSLLTSDTIAQLKSALADVKDKQKQLLCLSKEDVILSFIDVVNFRKEKCGNWFIDIMVVYLSIFGKNSRMESFMEGGLDWSQFLKSNNHLFRWTIIANLNNGGYCNLFKRYLNMEVDCPVVDDILHLLWSLKKIDRDVGLHKLQTALPDIDPSTLKSLQDVFISKLNGSQSNDDTAVPPWEVKHGSILACELILQSGQATLEFTEQVLLVSLHLLTDQEVRVRQAAGETLGTLCKVGGSEIYRRCHGQVLTLVRNNLERHFKPDDQQHTEALIEKLIGSHKNDPDGGVQAAQIFHDTAGWRYLETSMKCLQLLVEGCGSNFRQFVDADLVDVVFRAIGHSNRFVRETGYYLLGAIAATNADAALSIDSNPMARFGMHFATSFARGLSDNWSQVRLAASVGTRRFLLALTTHDRQQFFHILLPPMCLNRFYLAEGVRLYSQESWRLVVGDSGRNLVAAYMDSVVAFYIAQSVADNHAVREAACHAIAELAQKIEQSTVLPHVSNLLNTLLACFNDDSWPVRDAACVACGNFISCYPDSSRSNMPQLYPLFFANLSDCIPSVRLGAAEAIACVVKAYGDEAVEIVWPRVAEGLRKVNDQTEAVDTYSGLHTGGLSTYGVVKRIHDNDLDVHTDQTMYSCGSLAPRMSRGGGCSDHNFRKPSQPWEMTDGCVHLVAELCTLGPALQAKVISAGLLDLVVDALKKRSYVQHVALLETACRRLPGVAKSLGKQQFKPLLDKFFEPIFYGLRCGSTATEVAASDCLRELATFLGRGIISGRVEMYNPACVPLLEEVLQTSGIHSH